MRCLLAFSILSLRSVQHDGNISCIRYIFYIGRKRCKILKRKVNSCDPFICANKQIFIYRKNSFELEVPFGVNVITNSHLKQCFCYFCLKCFPFLLIFLCWFPTTVLLYFPELYSLWSKNWFKTRDNRITSFI